MAGKKSQMSVAITPIEYSGLQEAYDHFNKELFSGELPDVFITYQRKARSLGYFSADRFNGRLDQTGRHELALNPDGFIGESDKEICSTLVHEQHHVWQHVIGTAPKRGYHDREWAAKMKANGLQPSSTGMVGGRETGQHMDHYVIPGGRFEQAYDKLAASNRRIGLARRKGRARRPSSPVRVVASRMFGASRIAASTVTTARLACGRQLRSYHQRGSLPWRFASTRRPCQHPPHAEAWS